MKYTLMILSALFLMASGSPALGQGSERDMLMDAVQRTDQVIEQAGELVGRSNSERARALFSNAVSLQNRARSLMEMDDVMGNLTRAIQAGKYTRSAREKALQAIAVARQEAENEDYIRRRLERSSDIIQRAQGKMGPNAPENLELLLNGAREKQRRAVELFRNRQYKMSLQLTLQVEKSLENMTEEAGGYLKAKERYESLQERYFTLLDRLEQSASRDDPQIRAQIEKAEIFRKNSEDFASQQGFEKAEDAMQNAVRMLLEVSEQIKEPGKLANALEILSRQAEIFRERIGRSGDQNLQKIYRNALDHLDRAAALYREERYDEATIQLQAARQLLNQINRMIESKG